MVLSVSAWRMQILCRVRTAFMCIYPPLSGLLCPPPSSLHLLHFLSFYCLSVWVAVSSSFGHACLHVLSCVCPSLLVLFSLEFVFFSAWLPVCFFFRYNMYVMSFHLFPMIVCCGLLACDVHFVSVRGLRFWASCGRGSPYTQLCVIVFVQLSPCCSLLQVLRCV